jgi:nicotinamidase-related amidase
MKHFLRETVIYLNWVFTKAELKKLPPSTIFGYGRSGLINDSSEHKFTGPGFPLPAVQLEDGKVVNAGDMFMQGSWNAELYGPLQKLYEQGKDMQDKQDVVLRTQWMNMGKELENFLEARGLTTLLFAGLNTEEAVWAVSLQIEHVMMLSG